MRDAGRPRPAWRRWTGHVMRPSRCYGVTAADGCHLRIQSSGRPSAALVEAVDALTHYFQQVGDGGDGKEARDVPDVPASDRA